ncbi:Nuclear receptor [Aphelenchoides fujianensis]|nr:Nuclear receptor [Aphelenchoides fujianensis]
MAARRAFFRRSVLNGGRYACERAGGCDVRAGGRCRACRWDACLRAGMNAAAVRLPRGVDAGRLLAEVAERKRALDARAVVQTKRPPDWPLCAEHVRRRWARPDRHWMATDWILGVEFLKALPVFDALRSADQEALVVHVVLVCVALSEAWYSLGRGAPTVEHPDGVQPLALRPLVVPTIAQLFPEILPLEHDSFVRHIEALRRVRPDRDEYCLLKAVICCHAETPGLSAESRRRLEAQREVYARALRRRLQARRGTAAGARQYADVIALVQSFFHFAQKKRELHVFLRLYETHGERRAEPPLLDWFMSHSSRDD